MWLLLIASFVPHDQVVEDAADVCELNHVLDERGSETLTQVIWWKLATVDFEPGYFILDWRLSNQTGRPEYDHRNREWVVEWFDAKTNSTRRVKAKVFRETWTYYDREVEDRKRLPECQRRKLSAPKEIETKPVAVSTATYRAE